MSYVRNADDERDLAWSDRPVTHHAGDYVVEGRRVLVASERGAVRYVWPHAPEECPDTWLAWTWVAAGRVLCCPGCGLDGT